MRFTHHPRFPDFRFDPDKIYDNTDATFKPRGLWLSVDGDWQRWCKDEEMYLDRTHSDEIVFEVNFDRVLHLQNSADIDRFTQQYGTNRRSDFGYLDWIDVAEQWDGMVIAPYCWERRLDINATWYYPWDCASACIWNLNAVTEAKLVWIDDA